MIEDMKHIRLEKHEDRKNCHRHYVIRIEHLGGGQFRVRAEWGRCAGFRRKASLQVQTKDVVGSIVDAMAVFHDYRIAKEQEGYKQVGVMA